MTSLIPTLVFLFFITTLQARSQSLPKRNHNNIVCYDKAYKAVFYTSEKSFDNCMYSTNELLYSNFDVELTLQCHQKTICFAGCLKSQCIKTGILKEVMTQKLNWSSRFIGMFCAYFGFAICMVYLVYYQGQNRLENYQFMKSIRPGSEISLLRLIESPEDDSDFSERNSQVAVSGQQSFYSDL